MQKIREITPHIGSNFHKKLILVLSKNKIKLIRSLERKKSRNEEGLFVAEGPKILEELLPKWTPVYIAATQEWMDQNSPRLRDASTEFDVVRQEELERASLLRTPQQVIALFRIPTEQSSLAQQAANELCLALDGVQDPGNIGTIIRLADWFGIQHVFCSHDTADIFSPKAIQATMGAIARVHVHYLNLPDELRQCTAPIYGTHLDGDNIYDQSLSQHGIIVMGNEGKGVSKEVSQLVSKRLYIPPYPAHRDKVESLNVAIATAIVCAEFRRFGTKNGTQMAQI